jgi:thioredoxin reductase
LEHTVSEIYGNDRLQGVKIARVDKDGNIIRATERDVACDCLLLSVGLIPENELSMEAGIEIDERINGPVVDEYLQTSIAGIFAAGNVVQVWDLVDNVTLDGEKTGTNAARFIAGDLKRAPSEIKVMTGENVKTVTPHKICGTDPVEITLRVDETIEKAELKVGNFHKNYKVVSPTEVLKITLQQSDLEAFRQCAEIEVSCSKRRKEKKNA